MTKKKKNIIIAVSVVVVLIIILFVAWTERSFAPSVSLRSVGSTTSTPTASSTGISPTGTTSSSAPGASISFERFYQGTSFTFSYPQSWTILNVAPFSMTNFNGAYGPGQTLPPGGAEIDIVTTTVYSGFENIMQTDMMGSHYGSTSTTVVDGTSCTRAQYQDAHAGFSTATVALYCEKGTELWQIYLAYRVGDSATATHISDLDEVLSTMKFIP